MDSSLPAPKAIHDPISDSIKPITMWAKLVFSLNKINRAPRNRKNFDHENGTPPPTPPS